MPLRSVEAATRDDAIAAAREQFGATARVVGVRRVRSGGVLGFFATERYVAEVDPDPAPRPSVPLAALARGEADRRPREDDRPAAPSRNGAAAYADVRATPSTPRRSALDDDARVDEIAGLLGSAAPASSTRRPVARPAARTPRAEPAPAPARAAVVRPAAVRPAWSELLAPAPERSPAPAPAPAPAADPQPAGPSPFTAALARMVAGDRDVQQAVEDALAAPGEAPDALPGSAPTRSEPLPAAQTTATPSVAPREEEPVELQDWTPSSPSFDAPAWGAAQPAPAPATSREAAIAEVLRAAVDEGRSEESLTGILRRVMDGASPAAALAEAPFEPPVEVPAEVSATVNATVTEAAAAPEIAQVVVAEPVVVPEMVLVEEPAAVVAVEPVVQPVVEVPVAEVPLVEVPLVEVPVAEVPVLEVAPEPVVEVAAVEAPVVAAPVVEEWTAAALLGSDLGWDDTASSSLWADASPAPVAEAPAAEPVAEVVEVVEEAAVLEAPAAEAVQGTAEEIVEEVVAQAQEDVVEEVSAAPVLARTASDPAPLSLDATSVMPPLSLLPPLPGSRRGGRPPVPPSVQRGASSRSAARPAAPAQPPAPEPAAVEPLATVTRLPLVPAEETGAPVEKPEPNVVMEAPAPEAPVAPAAEVAAPETPADETAVIPAVPAEPVVRRPEPAPVRRPAVVVPAPAPRAERPRPAAVRPAPAPAGDLVAGLTALGLPEDLLDGGFAADAAAQGTYAALTRALAGRLPETPELPRGAGEVLVVVGPGVETLRAARALAATLHLDTDRVLWATRGDLAGLVPAASRMATVEAAIERRQESIGSGTLTVVAVDAPLRADAYWTAQMLAIWAPVAVWAVVEATRKPEDLGPWIEGLPRVDALVVQDTDLSADPAAVLHRVALPLDLPVAVVDGMRATPHRWASLLCERLETPEG